MNWIKVILILITSPVLSQIEHKEITVNGVRRHYIVYTPKKFEPTQKHPSTAEAQQKAPFLSTALNAVADTAGFLVV